MKFRLCLPQLRGQLTPSAHNYASCEPTSFGLGGHGRSVTGGSLRSSRVSRQVLSVISGKLLVDKTARASALAHLLQNQMNQIHPLQGRGLDLDPGQDRGLVVPSFPLATAPARGRLKQRSLRLSPAQHYFPPRDRYAERFPPTHQNVLSEFGRRAPGRVVVIPPCLAAFQPDWVSLLLPVPVRWQQPG